MTTPPRARRPARNHWLDAEPELDRAADVASKMAAKGTYTQRERPPDADAGDPSPDMAAAGLSNPGNPGPARVLVSAAAGYTIGEPPTGRLIRPVNNENWSPECWAFYDAEGALHYAAGQYARAVSRGRLYVATYDSDGEVVEATEGDAGRLNRELLGGEAKRSDLLFLSSVQQFMTGQSLLTVKDVKGGGQEWDAFSDQDFHVDRSTMRYANTASGRALYEVDLGTGSREPLTPGTLTIHMWDRHPGRAYTVDSSVRPALPYLRELARLDQYVQALLLSRIALSGILQLPPNTEVIVPPELKQMIGDQGGDGNGLMHVLAAIGVQNISNPGTAAAVLPVLLQMGHPDHKLEHLTLDQPLTAEINAFREINLKRLAMSMDIAPEALSGFADVKYSNAEWIMNESVQTHIIRRLNAFASALTTYYVVPALDANHFVAVDISDLESDEDRTSSAIELYDRGELDGDGLRRKAKMRDTSPPEGEELLRQLAVRAVTVNPSLLPVLAPLLGLRQSITLTPEQEQALIDAGPGDSGSKLEPEPIPDNQDPRELPERAPRNPTVREPQPLPAAAFPVQRTVPDALISACDVVVCGALASAGSRWRRKARWRSGATRGLDAQAVYLKHPLCTDAAGQDQREYVAALVADRWPQVPRIAALHAADPHCLQATLANYVTELIVRQRPHHPRELVHAVAYCLDTPPGGDTP